MPLIKAASATMLLNFEIVSGGDGCCVASLLIVHSGISPMFTRRMFTRRKSVAGNEVSSQFAKQAACRRANSLSPTKNRWRSVHMCQARSATISRQQLSPSFQYTTTGCTLQDLDWLMVCNCRQKTRPEHRPCRGELLPVEPVPTYWQNHSLPLPPPPSARTDLFPPVLAGRGDMRRSRTPTWRWGGSCRSSSPPSSGSPRTSPWTRRPPCAPWRRLRGRSTGSLEGKGSLRRAWTRYSLLPV